MTCNDSELPNGLVSEVCINDRLGDDELRVIVSRLESEKDKEVFGLVCKRWLLLQSTERKKLCARAGPHMLRKIAARFSQLDELDLSQPLPRSFYPGITDSDLSVIATAFYSLRILNLHNCKGITDNGIAAIGSSFSSLQSLDVSYCRKLRDNGLSAVAEGCRELRTLNLSGCRLVSDSLLKALSKNCHNLEELGLQGCINITDTGLCVLVEGCRNIKHLDINKCSNIGNIGVSAVSKACASILSTLKLLDCFKVGDESILSLADNCKNLETLVIGGCRNISDESMKSLAVACSKSLRKLRMDWCLNIYDSSLDCILSGCRNLEVLDIGCCEGVTDAAFQHLGSGELMLELKILKASNCRKITIEGIKKLLNSCESLEYLDVRSCPHITKAGCEEAGLHFPESFKVNYSGGLAEPNVLL
ncbi:unnamed protein product [Withania somnifera]